MLVLSWPLSSSSRHKSKNDADEAVSVVSLISNSGGYINGRNSANLELLIDKTSSIYLYVKLKALASWIFLSLQAFEETPTHMSIKINRLEEGHNSYPLVCRWPADTVSLQRRQICYRWGNPAYWSLVLRSSMFYIFEFCLKNMRNCSLTQQILSHSFYDWKLCELFLLSGVLICHAVGWYKELKNQKFWWRIPERKILISGYPKDL